MRDSRFMYYDSSFAVHRSSPQFSLFRHLRYWRVVDVITRVRIKERPILMPLNPFYRCVSRGRKCGCSSDTQQLRGEFTGIPTYLRGCRLDCWTSTTVPHQSHSFTTAVRAQEVVVDNARKK